MWRGADGCWGEDGVPEASGLSGRRVVVTAGGTREPIDPVRVITNRSTGKMGLALASAAQEGGAEVTLVSTVEPAGDTPFDVRMVETVAEMREAVLNACRGTDALIIAASRPC